MNITPFAGGKTFAPCEITKFRMDMDEVVETHYGYVVPNLSDDILIGYLVEENEGSARL